MILRTHIAPVPPTIYRLLRQDRQAYITLSASQTGLEVLPSRNAVTLSPDLVCQSRIPSPAEQNRILGNAKLLDYLLLWSWDYAIACQMRLVGRIDTIKWAWRPLPLAWRLGERCCLSIDLKRDDFRGSGTVR